MTGNERLDEATMQAEMQSLRRWFGNGAWCLDFARLVGSSLVMGGWIEAPDPEAELSIRVNGRPVDWITRGIRLPSLGAAFPFLAGSEFGGFRARITLSDAEAAAKDAMVECVRTDDGTPLSQSQTVWVPLPAAADEGLALPDPSRVSRISGNDSVDLFRLEGASIAHGVSDLCARHGVPFDRAAAVLDWGVGCGRVARFLSRTAGVRYVGVDVDADNVAWCNKHLDKGRYHAIPLLPPSQFPAAIFDIVIGISVVTHLREEVQLRWLEELARITRPQGLVLLSVHGEQAASRGLRGAESINRYIETGFVFGKQPHALDAILNDAEYYGTAFHTASYVEKNWSRWLDVVEIIPAGIGNHQDLVVLRRSTSTV